MAIHTGVNTALGTPVAVVRSTVWPAGMLGMAPAEAAGLALALPEAAGLAPATAEALAAALGLAEGELAAGAAAEPQPESASSSIAAPEVAMVRRKCMVSLLTRRDRLQAASFNYFFTYRTAIREAASRKTLGLALRPPGLVVVLDALEDGGQDHAGAGDDDDAHEHLVRLEGVAG